MRGELLTLRVQKMASGGEGLAFRDGQAVFIPYSIPGELCACRVIESAHDYLRAEVIDILEPSPSRIRPPCPLFGRCGGCGLQHMEYEVQKSLKAEAARESCVRIAGFDPGPLRMEAGTPYAYRNRVQIHPCPDGGLGFMEGLSDIPLRAPGCPVAVHAIDAWLKTQNRKSKPWKELKARIGDRERFVVFAQDEVLSIEGERAFGTARIGGLDYSFPLGHFFQSNLAMAERLLDEAVSGESGDLALDLYSGAGLFAARLSSAFKSTVLVESDTVSLEAARKNLAGKEARFHARDLESWTAGCKGGADLVLVDPPRAGLSARVRSWLLAFKPSRLVYISCDHQTLARDLGQFLKAGWNLESLTLYDFYPQTGRLEALAKLSPPQASGAARPDAAAPEAAEPNEAASDKEDL